MLANLFFLAHAIIPHHHHHSELCFATSHCIADSNHEHDNCCTNDSKQDVPTDRCCALQDAAAMPADQVKASPKISYELLPQLGGLCAILTRFNYSPQQHLSESEISYADFDFPLYSQYIFHSIGLRAPPRA